MNPEFLSNDELASAFAAAKKEALAGTRITSWSTQSTSVTKSADAGAAGASARANLLAREIRFRIREGRIDAAQYPELTGLDRRRERIRA